MNIQNRTMFTADNLPILRGIDSESVDLIYLDPPFNSKKQWSAPIGSKAAGAAFKDTWTYDDVDDAWLGEIARTNEPLHEIIHAARLTGGKPNAAYLIYMAPRLIEMHRVLKGTGSIYLHCDPTMSHSLKLMMDSIFGAAKFRNEIVWHYYNKFSAGKRVFGRNYDQILFYVKDTKNYLYNPLRELRDKPVRQLVRENIGGVLKNKRGTDGKVVYRTATDKKVDAVWRIPCVQPASKHYTGYPTQKPIDLLKRIIEASSAMPSKAGKHDGGFVLDPFAGCATTAIAAELLGRRWAGVDVSAKAVELVRHRYQREIGMLLSDLKVRTTPPKRSDAVKRSRNIKDILFGRQQGYCAGCKHFMQYQHLEVDHIVPRSKGGQDDDSNLQLLCGHCNRIKGNRTMAYLLSELKKVPSSKPD